MRTRTQRANMDAPPWCIARAIVHETCDLAARWELLRVSDFRAEDRFGVQWVHAVLLALGLALGLGLPLRWRLRPLVFCGGVNFGGVSIALLTLAFLRFDEGVIGSISSRGLGMGAKHAGKPFSLT